MLRDLLESLLFPANHRVGGNSLGRVGRRPKRSPSRRPPSIERLESRSLLTAIPVGPEFLVNTFTTDNQSTLLSRAVATDQDGDFVVTWTSAGQDGSGDGVYAQRFSAAGVAQGSEFRVNTYTTNNQNRSAVAMDAAGNFIITWESAGQDGSDRGIYAQRFNAGGVAQGSEFRVNTYTTNIQRSPAVAMDEDGDFIITWTSWLQAGGFLSLYDIYAQRYNAAGVAQGGEFLVNSFTQSYQAESSVAMDANGNFVVAWNGYLPPFGIDMFDIVARRFNAAGIAQGNEFLVRAYTYTQAFSSIAMDADGDFVIVWESYSQDGDGHGVYAQRYNAAAVAQGGEFRVNSTTLGSQRYASAAMDAQGDFVVTWTSYDHQDGIYSGVYVQQYNAAGVAQGGELLVNTFTIGTQNFASVAMDASGDFVVTWTSYQDGSGKGVNAQRYDGSPVTVNGVFTPTDIDPITQNEVVVQNISQLVVGFSEELAITGAGSVTDVANWSLSKNGVDITARITGISFAFNSLANRFDATLTLAGVMSNGAYVLTAKQSILDPNGNAIDGDGNGSAGGDFVRSFGVAIPPAVGPEFRVNGVTSGDQRTYRNRTVATDQDGAFVVTWTNDGQDGSDYGVYAQRYDAAGVAQGSEFRVNSYTTGKQYLSSVAMDSGGNFVITWTSVGQDGDGYGVYAQRYDAGGVALGSEFRVNPTATGAQQFSAVAMAEDGDFVITWTTASQEANGYFGGIDVYARRFSAGGVAQGSVFRVNSYTIDNQLDSSVAMDAEGNFVITWNSVNQDGDLYGVYAQRYNALGEGQGSEFLVNTHTTGAQLSPSVAMDAEGDFVIAWTSVSQDGDDAGVYAQRYNAAGVALGGEILVNTYTTFNQASPSAAMNADGDFVIVWESFRQESILEISNGVYAQRYNAAGLAQGAQFRVNTFTTGQQYEASVAMDADGDFVISWSSSNQDGDGYGVYAQRFDATWATVGVFSPGDHRPITENDREIQSISQLIVGFSEGMVASGPGSVTNTSNWSLTRNGVLVTAQITGITYGYNPTADRYDAALTLSSPLSQGEYVLTAKQSLRDMHDHAIDGDGSQGGDFVRAFRVATPVAIGPEFSVNTYKADNQITALWGRSVAMDHDGNFVITWSSYPGQDGSGFGIYAQRYNASRIAQGPEFRVNSYTSLSQYHSSIAMDADGDFVITWESDSQDGRDVYAQRYDASGVAQGAEFRVNHYTTDDQVASSVAMDADGDFVITWNSYSQDGSSWGVYAQRYNAAGVAQGSEFLVNSLTIGNQVRPSVAMDSDGDFVVTWTGVGPVGSTAYARRFNAAGDGQGSECLVSSFTSFVQGHPSVSMDADGDFVVAWESLGQDEWGYGIYAQRFDAAGVPQGDEFRVNFYTVGNQQHPSVSMDSDGDFVIGYQSDIMSSGDYNELSDVIYARQFSAAGVAQGPAFIVKKDNDYGDLQMPSMAIDADGDFVIVWTGRTEDNSTFDVYARYYGNRAPIAGITGPLTAVRGAATSFTLTATDTPANPDGLFTYEIDWDNNGVVDQTVVGLGSGASVWHTFTEIATETVRVWATDFDGATSAAATLVVNVAPYALIENAGLFDLHIGGTMGSDFYSFWGLGGRDVGVITGDLGILRVDGVTGKILIYMQDGDDTITVEAGMNDFDIGATMGDGFNIFAPLGGSNATYFVFGGDDVDQFFLVGGPNVTTYFYGGGGDDVYLDVSGDPTNVTHFYGDAGNDGVAAGLGADYLEGGDGNDMLVGGFYGADGNDTLIGGAGDDFLVGGPGEDNLDGGEDSDLLVSGSLVFLPSITDGYLPIWAEWGFSGHGFSERILNIGSTIPLSNRLNGDYFIENGDTALDDGAIDTILGGDDSDWFVGNAAQDLASDFVGGDEWWTNLT